jgi:hypothetical protein
VAKYAPVPPVPLVHPSTGHIIKPTYHAYYQLLEDVDGQLARLVNLTRNATRIFTTRGLPEHDAEFLTFRTEEITTSNDMSDVEEAPVDVAAEEVEVTQDADAPKGGQMSVEDALKKVLKTALVSNFPIFVRPDCQC